MPSCAKSVPWPIRCSPTPKLERGSEEGFRKQAKEARSELAQVHDELKRTTTRSKTYKRQCEECMKGHLDVEQEHIKDSRSPRS
jgi:hypothetical protein